MTNSNAAEKIPFIPNHRRDLYFKIIDTHPNIHDVTMRLYYLEDRFPSDKLDRALKWLVNNRIVGRTFVTWFHTECKKSDLEMHRNLLAIVDNADLGRIIAGKNFKL